MSSRQRCPHCGISYRPGAYSCCSACGAPLELNAVSSKGQRGGRIGISASYPESEIPDYTVRYGREIFFDVGYEKRIESTQDILKRLETHQRLLVILYVMFAASIVVRVFWGL